MNKHYLNFSEDICRDRVIQDITGPRDVCLIIFTINYLELKIKEEQY